ncbi:hypothetical protein IV203_008043 [Nitzschia inconspicua]|uniref:SCP domain-containing protein n=1 Tax=Nitzschia inconspicua TaxID=303405 RepID=A0A9K3KXU7_9STRA|nr:hypothetical protein IV203_008043 [Nitzschia inconspicua]
MTSTASSRGISLCEALEAGRTIVPPGTEDRSLSLSSGYTADPSEFTERSVSSSVCLSETGQVMVSTRMYSPKYSGKTPSFLPPPPLTEGEAEVFELPRKPKSIRRSSMFGSTTSISNSIHETAKKPLNSNMTKPRRRSFFGSGATIDQDLPHQSQLEHLANESALRLDVHDKIAESPASLPRSSARSTFFNVSCRSITKDGTEESCDNRSTSTRNSKSKSGRKIAKFFSHIRKTHNEHPACSGGISKSTMDSTASHELEALPEQGKKQRSRRRHSLFGGMGGAEKRSQEDTVASRSLTRPPPTPAHPRRRRRSLFGNVDAEKEGGADAHSSARPTESTNHHQKPGFQRLLGKGTETETAALTPRINNPYELVNNERIRRNLHPFIRSMLLDSVAKDVALQLSRSNGARCRPTDYHGNIGKGVDVWTIHEKMMAQKGTEKSNIISSHFYHYGIGIARDREGQIYLCQLFQ